MKVSVLGHPQGRIVKGGDTPSHPFPVRISCKSKLSRRTLTRVPGWVLIPRKKYMIVEVRTYDAVQFSVVLESKKGPAADRPVWLQVQVQA